MIDTSFEGTKNLTEIRLALVASDKLQAWSVIRLKTAEGSTEYLGLASVIRLKTAEGSTEYLGLALSL